MATFVDKRQWAPFPVTRAAQVGYRSVDPPKETLIAPPAPHLRLALAEALARSLRGEGSPPQLRHRAYHGAQGDLLPLTLVAWDEVWGITVDGVCRGIEIEGGACSARPLWSERLVPVSAGADPRAPPRRPGLPGLQPSRPSRGAGGPWGLLLLRQPGLGAGEGVSEIQGTTRRSTQAVVSQL